VLTSLEAGNANAAVPDNEVLAFARSEGRILLSHNRRHFLRLHQHRTEDHAGIVVCSFDPDFSALAQRIHDAVGAWSETNNQLIRVNRRADAESQRDEGTGFKGCYRQSGSFTDEECSNSAERQ
jgi:Domain of unknown function (DUF5615)